MLLSPGSRLLLSGLRGVSVSTWSHVLDKAVNEWRDCLLPAFSTGFPEAPEHATEHVQNTVGAEHVTCSKSYSSDVCASLLLCLSASQPVSLLLCFSASYKSYAAASGCSNNYNYPPCSATVAKQALVLAGGPKRGSAESRHDVLQQASEEPIPTILLSIYLSQHNLPPILPFSSSPRLAPLPRLLASLYRQSRNLPPPRLGPS